MKSIFSIPLILALLCFMSLSCTAEDLTLVAKTSGRDVVEAVVTKLGNSGIFGSDKRFLTRIAWVETEFGTRAETYSSSKEIDYSLLVCMCGMLACMIFTTTSSNCPSKAYIFSNTYTGNAKYYGCSWNKIERSFKYFT
jgi:hypothetical protein